MEGGTEMDRRRLIDVASGKIKAELVIKNAEYLNVFTGEVEHADIAIDNGLIAGIGNYQGEKTYYADGLVVPGFIDGHIHIESSMTTPKQFAAEAIRHGTTTVVCDPHEIANIAGAEGIEFMISSARAAEIDLKFMLPSCVPATLNYAALSARDLMPLYEYEEVIGLAEVMDVPALLNKDGDMLEKIEYALTKGVVDGHAPSLSGKELNAYIAAGITSDHECTTLLEAEEKLRLGQYIMIREGTAAHNLRALVPLINKYPHRCMFVTDDLHPDQLEEGHIDGVIKKAVSCGADYINSIISATLTPAERFGLSDRGAIAVGRRADLAVLKGLSVTGVFCAKVPHGCEIELKTGFNAKPITADDIAESKDVIRLICGEILTEDGGEGDSILFAYERHHGTGKKAACRLSGYGIKKGAVATSIAHDSHNIIAAGAAKEDIAAAVNRLIEIGGGIVVACGGEIRELPLKIGGIMCDKPVRELAKELKEIKDYAFSLGINEDVDPFMSLSFLSLPVIPAIRLLPSGVVRV